MKLDFRFHHFCSCQTVDQWYYQCTKTKAWKCSEVFHDGRKQTTYATPGTLSFTIKSEEELIEKLK